MTYSPILIVDDDQKVLNALQRELLDYDFQPMLTRSSAEAFEILSKNPCKIVLADVKMVGMDGLELLTKIHELYPDIIRMVLSGHGNTELILKNVNKQGIDRYFTKPWQIDDIVMAFQQAIELYDLRHEVAELRNRQ